MRNTIYYTVFANGSGEAQLFVEGVSIKKFSNFGNTIAEAAMDTGIKKVFDYLIKERMANIISVELLSSLTMVIIATISEQPKDNLVYYTIHINNESAGNLYSEGVLDVRFPGLGATILEVFAKNTIGNVFTYIEEKKRAEIISVTPMGSFILFMLAKIKDPE